MMKTGIIYKVISPSGKVYIGQTIQQLSTRRSNHFSVAFNSRRPNGYNSKFSKAIRKYKDKLKWEIIYNLPKRYLNDMEITVIEWYNSYKNGYNSTVGGEAYKHTNKTKKKISVSMKGKRCLDETKKKISLSLKNRRLSAEHKNKISLSRKGQKLSDEHRNKISLSIKGYKRSDETKRKMSKAKLGVSNPNLSGDKNPRAKLTWNDVKEIRIKYTSGKYMYSELAKEYDVAASTIGGIVRNEKWVS